MRALAIIFLTKLGTIASKFVHKRYDSTVFFFFPYYHIGGAEKVHADIVGCFREARPSVFFTQRSHNSGFLKKFSETGAGLFDWSWLVRYFHYFVLGFVSAVINRAPSAVVFGCNTTFYYRLLPYLAPQVRKIDLLHAFGGGMEDFSLQYVSLLDLRVVINSKTVEDYRLLYGQAAIDPDYLDRIVVIENQVQVPARKPVKPENELLQVIYVGRGTEEKRVHLVGRIASRCHELKVPARFSLVGAVVESVDAADRINCLFKGSIEDFDELQKVYIDADVLLITSSREGFPVVVMEAMAHGAVPISTDVGGLSRHLRHGENGLLVDVLEEELIVEEMVAAISRLAQDRTLLLKLSGNAYDYAAEHFCGRDFVRKYAAAFSGSAQHIW